MELIIPREHQRTIQPNSESRNTWVEIDARAFEHNLKSYKSLVGQALFAPVIKSNAYGHGMELIARLCEQSPYVDWLCVISVHEALQLRRNGIQKPILVLSIINDDLKAAIALSIDLVLYDMNTAHMLNAYAQSLGLNVYVHIKIDTGLSRLGSLWYEATSFIRAVALLEHVVIRGIFTHFADSESDDLTFCNLQIERFTGVLQELALVGITIPLQHTSCSAATGAHSASHFTLARTGVGIYGLWPSPENKLKVQAHHPEFHLKPIMNWKTRIIQIKTIPAGSYVGYDRTHQVAQATTIATLPIGYWDGYDRGFSNKASMVVQGKTVRQVGRVAMNLTMIDSTGVSAHVGDEVTLLGNALGVTADDLATHLDTINYEVVTRINPLLPRVLCDK
jgi:alanine racemase